MAITSVPPDFPLADPLLCALCGVRLPLDKATAGLLDADNNQTFACVSHYWETERLIAGWADFVVRERARAASRMPAANELLYKGGGHAWLT